MNPEPNSHPPFSSRGLTWTGAAFLALGLAAIALPAWATVAVEQLVAALLLVWGAAGIGFALSMRPAAEWRMTAAIFAGVLVLGAIFLIFPRDGIETMTILLVAVFLIEGIATVTIGFGMRAVLPNWSFLVVSGLASLGLGVLILTGWPGTAAWTLGLLTGINFLSNGVTLILLGRAIGPSGRS